MADPILPSASVFATAAIDAIVAARPSTQVHFNNPNSTYSNIPPMWRAQALLLLARLGDEVKSARLKFATGDALRSLAASEFQVQLPPNPQTASGSIALTRTGIAPGVVRTGTQFTKLANPQAAPLAIPAATYTMTAPVYVAAGQLQATFNFVATASGASSNLPNFAGYDSGGLIVPAQTLFDSTFAASASTYVTLPDGTQVPVATAAGGSSGLPDPVVVAAARAYAVGQFGPTQGAMIAGLLQQQSVRHYAVFPASPTIPYATVYIADESWADAPQWHSSVAQVIANQWTAFGGRARFGNIINQQIAVNAALVLNSTDDLNFTDEIDANVRAVAESYFNDRPDWYRFRIGTLQSLLAKADSRIRKCTSAVVTDVLSGAVVPEPANNFQTMFSPTLTHCYLTDQNVTTSYSPPS